jgi:cytochrome bd-type quinol oxidase subunit 1
MGVNEGWQQLALVVASLALALAVGAVTNLVLGWILGPGWGTSMGLIAVLAGLVLALGGRGEDS